MIDFKNLPDAELLSEADIAALLPVLDEIAAWANGVKEYALAQAVEGKAHYNGYKVVAGRSNRVITNEEKFIETLEVEGYDIDEFYKRSLKGVGDIEKIVGKKKFESLSKGYIIKPAGKPCLVPESDKREAYDPNKAAVDDFKNEAIKED